MTTPLDNPAWSSLTGAHAPLAIGHGGARHYPRDMTPFSAIAEPSAAAYADLAADLPAGLEARLFRPSEEAPPPGWQAVSARPIAQMIADRRPAALPGPVPETLGADDVDATMALAAAAKPGPFDRRTGMLGRFVGIREQDMLMAMAGERFRLDGLVELSAICTHPAARGRGFGARVMIRLMQDAFDRGVQPFLHVFPDNPALQLYERLGFRTRAHLWVLWHRPLDA